MTYDYVQLFPIHAIGGMRVIAVISVCFIGDAIYTEQSTYPSRTKLMYGAK